MKKKSNYEYKYSLRLRVYVWLVCGIVDIVGVYLIKAGGHAWGKGLKETKSAGEDHVSNSTPGTILVVLGLIGIIGGSVAIWMVMQQTYKGRGHRVASRPIGREWSS